jgi:hypothetical protein
MKTFKRCDDSTASCSTTAFPTVAGSIVGLSA